MKKLLAACIAAAAGFAALPALAQGATLVLPSVVVNSPASTSITCTATGAPYTAPLAAGTTVFNCTVAPATWTGTVSLSGSQFTLSTLSGVTFNVLVGATALTAGTYSPGTLTATP